MLLHRVMLDYRSMQENKKMVNIWIRTGEKVEPQIYCICPSEGDVMYASSTNRHLAGPYACLAFRLTSAEEALAAVVSGREKENSGISQSSSHHQEGTTEPGF
ncbi:hypothetical protein CHARACLAT_015807 [Characodon lateralis]|uniref:SWIM-type domain-containing protein n=1 Tax=Characodon lateralis TaxID=208331 RepID=A0ABU7DSZ7_9TELE|nr:hypothetical protein [Characodon lateralis]